MRKTLLITSTLFIAILFTGCATNKPVETDEYYFATGYDFTQYTEQGFLFTPEGFPGEYEAMGIIRINHQPQFMEIPDQQRNQQVPGSRVYVEPDGISYWRVSEPDPDRMIQEAYDQATAMGADAIINFRIVGERITNGSLTVDSAVLHGFAIKRND